jgi:DMSO/TMAO reductase YedYZ molybdopterin-dependent catalytic subunit
VEGKVHKPIELTLAELRDFESQTETVTMECAGNGRSELVPKVKGVQWNIGAVGNAQWRGVRLRDLLARAGADASATEVILEGADRGEIKEPPRPPGEIQYARSLPIAKASDDVLLAYEMNGAPLTPEHGFPLRAVVPGWFGMASVKWLQRIIVTDKPFSGYYQTVDYGYWESRDGLPELKPLREMQVKAQIAQPRAGEVIDGGVRYRVHGAAWAGENELAKVEISTDSGVTWKEAELFGERAPYAWRFWQYDWLVPQQSGTCALVARATDSAGRTQPAERVAAYGSYVVNHLLPLEVTIR